MTRIQIESQNHALKITFSHRTGKNGDSSLHTGPLGCQNVPKSTDKHLATSGAPVLWEHIAFFIFYFDSISNRVTSTLQHKL